MSSSKKTPPRAKRQPASKAEPNSPLLLAGETIEPGTRQRLELRVARLATDTWLNLPVEVVHGRRKGARLWLSAAVHGDEVNGVEIIRRVLAQVNPQQLKGTLLAVPIVNVFGFIEQSRYLPDRRDLNRSFPGSAQGSLAARIAHLFMNEIVKRSTHGIDLHTASQHRTNLPQIRANLADTETWEIAAAFGPPLLIDARTRDGSLREAAAEEGIPVLLYEAGEAQRFNPDAIALGTDGVLRVMKSLKMWKNAPRRSTRLCQVADETSWVRARRGGLFRNAIRLGQLVEKRQELGTISSALGGQESRVAAPHGGIVVGFTQSPLVNRGDALVHLTKGDLKTYDQMGL